MSGIRHSYLSIGAAAALLGISRQQAWNLKQAGVLKSVRREVFLRGDVEKLRRLRAERKERERKARELRRLIKEKEREARREIAGGVKGDGRPGKV